MYSDHADDFSCIAVGMDWEANPKAGEVISPCIVDLDNDYFARFGHPQVRSRIYVWHRPVTFSPEFKELPTCWVIG